MRLNPTECYVFIVERSFAMNEYRRETCRLFYVDLSCLIELVQLSLSVARANVNQVVNNGRQMTCCSSCQ
jgi:hypothetical protein